MNLQICDVQFKMQPAICIDFPAGGLLSLLDTAGVDMLVNVQGVTFKLPTIELPVADAACTECIEEVIFTSYLSKSE